MPRHKKTRVLTPQEEKFAEAIAQGQNMTQACAVVNITRKTGYIWRRRPEIDKAIADLEAAKGETRVRVIEEFQATRTRVLLTEIDEKLKTSAGRAVEVLIEIMESGKRDSDRIAACDRIIKLAGVTEQQTVAHGSERTTSSKGLSENVAATIRKQVLGITTPEDEPVETTTEEVNAPKPDSDEDQNSSLYP